MNARNEIAALIDHDPAMKAAEILRMLNIPVCLATIALVIEVRDAVKSGR
jgi:hypothetical protein